MGRQKLEKSKLKKLVRLFVEAEKIETIGEEKLKSECLTLINKIYENSTKN